MIFMKVPVSVYAEMTPNPNTMKFVVNKNLVEGAGLEFNSSMDSSASPIATKLLNFPFVENVFISGNFITITKNDKIEWDLVVMDVRQFITDFLKEGNLVIAENVDVEALAKANQAIDESSLNVVTNDLDKKIIETLDEYIRPAVENDGGSIDFKSFENGIVTVVLRGSCSGCPSSTVTLKHGVENLLTRTIPEVKEVIAESM